MKTKNKKEEKKKERNDQKVQNQPIIEQARIPASDASPAMLGTSVQGVDHVGQAHWYVVHTYAGQEEKVAAALNKRIASENLGDRIFDIIIPTQKKIEIREGKKQESEERIFPGYILVKMILDDYSWLAVRSTTGVTGFVGVRNRPTPLPDEEVEIIRKFSALEAPKFKTAFSVGEAVKIVDGPFAEFLGTVNEIDEEKGKVKVLVSIFGRETPVELDFLQVTKL
jgi:transcriptional antiterminator NusG